MLLWERLNVVRPLKVILLEDSDLDAALVKNEIDRSGLLVDLSCVNTSAHLFQKLSHESCDVLVLDYALHGTTAEDLFDDIRKRNANLPIIIISGAVGEEVVISCLKKGANDYVMKGNLRRLPIAIERVVREVKEKIDLKIQMEQAQKREAACQLTVGLAHDFNNLLIPILGMSEMVAARIADPQLKSYMEVISSASKRARDLVRQMLLFTREESGGRIPVSISKLVEEVRDLLRSTVPGTTTVRISSDGKDDVVLADPVKIHQIIVNLATNAAHSMKSNGGELNIDVRRHMQEGESRFGDLKLTTGAYVMLEVRDTGHGMDGATIERIFEPFFSTKPTGEGTGLGLSVVHSIVRELSGSIRVHSEPGFGTSFKIYLPHYVEAPHDGQENAPKLEALQNLRIAYVDDEPSLLKVIEELLQFLGNSVTTFPDATRALDVLSKDPARFDLLITDARMPGIDGVELARQVVRRFQALRVIICSGEPVQALKDPELTNVGLLLKPFDLNQLSDAITLALRKPKS